MTGRERLLLIDTCGETAGVALSIGQELLIAEELRRGKASTEIVSTVRRLLQQVSWRLAELDAIGVVNGPGSFTGTRAGLAAAKGMCEAAGLPLIAVSRLEVLAEATPSRDGFVALNAGRGELYVRDQTTGREWLCSSGDLALLGSSNKGRGIVIAEERLAECFRGCETVLYALNVGDALSLVLRRLHEEASDVAPELSLIDANYVREESDIYRKQADIAEHGQVEAS